MRAATLRLLVVLLGLALLGVPSTASASDTTVVRFTTTLGTIDVQMLSDEAPRTVANFLAYVNRRAYDGAVVHRSVKGFVIQGGGFRDDDDTITAIPADPPVRNEPGVSNLRGTLAMAKVGDDPNSATNQWFFNESDANAANLDTQNGGFTVFGRIVDQAGLGVMDAIGALPTTDASAAFGNSAFTQLPVRDYAGAGKPARSNVVFTTSVAVLPASGGSTPAPGGSTQPGSTAQPPGSPTAAKPVTAARFRLTTRALSAPTLRRASSLLRVRVLRLPARTKLTATLEGAGRKLHATATAPAAGGTARVTFRFSRAARAVLRKGSRGGLLLRVTARPPGGPATQAATVVFVKR